MARAGLPGLTFRSLRQRRKDAVRGRFDDGRRSVEQAEPLYPTDAVCFAGELSDVAVLNFRDNQLKDVPRNAIAPRRLRP